MMQLWADYLNSLCFSQINKLLWCEKNEQI